MKCSVFIATSLDGFIAREDGSIDWLMKANTLALPGEDGGYKSFISTVDGLVMGRNSYEKVLSFDEWPYVDLPVVVMSSQPITIPEHLRACVSTTREDPVSLVNRLSKLGLKHLYIDGGVTIQGFLINNLINEMTITLIPILLGSGRSLFGSLKHDIELQHVSIRTFEGGFVQIKYRIGTSQEE
ncbi:dihydrofolate reductase family protein [Legionella maioricensis]|uniref:Dihydrofolate reductase family protein n=1 Tax=Legionella maioricensis TaxID=2896528 RepID=A0A9X2D332_9GAMM|nr:dihydrofolate reductase family protein [Legionella maioricensis]MCL9685558.1 dihydrofolate reductase family protein [Legionella maioricensis]MCL9688882.1 dihydrofolate reductase family protein [Legionella maioricensis]